MSMRTRKNFCLKLEIGYMIDDSRKVLKHFTNIQCTPFFFGNKENELGWVSVPSWKHFRKKDYEDSKIIRY